MIAIKFIGIQEGIGDLRGFPLYNTTSPEGEIPAGATLALPTLRKLGWQAPAQEPLVIVRSHPQGGWTHAWLEEPGVSSCRVYDGWWPTEQAANVALAAIARD